MSPAGRLCFDIFSPPSGDSDVISQVERLSSNEMNIAPRSLRIAFGASGRLATVCMVVSRVGGRNLTLPERRSLSTSPWDLDMGLLQEFEPAELHERDATAGEFDFERSTMVRGAEQDALLFQQNAAFAVLQHARNDIVHLIGLVTKADEPGRSAAARSVQRFLVKRSCARSMMPLAAARIGCVER